MKNLVSKAPELIREAAKSTLGTIALVVLLLSILALSFFATASENIKVIIFIMIFIGAGLFVSSVIRFIKPEQTQEKAHAVPGDVSNVQKDLDQVAAFCYRPKNASIEILLVKSDGGRWIFPKGGIEKGEEPWQAAEREASEEAGATGTITHEALTTFLHLKRGLKQTGIELRVAIFPLLVKNTQRPQEKKRKPTWFSPHDAEKALMEDRQFKYAAELKRVVRLGTTNLT